MLDPSKVHPAYRRLQPLIRRVQRGFLRDRALITLLISCPQTLRLLKREVTVGALDPRHKPLDLVLGVLCVHVQQRKLA